MNKVKKLFGEINMTWPKVIVFAIIVAVYTALINQVPFLYDTSFRDIAIGFECWILFAIIIIMNCKKPIESATKTFVFFLISQPLIYLIETPFLGLGILGYYKNWFIWTILTFPMAFIGWYMKKDNLLGLLILSPIALFLLVHAEIYIQNTIYNFPNHLLSAIFCIAQVFVLIYCIFSKKKERIIGFSVSALLTLVIIIYVICSPMTYKTILMSTSDNVNFNENWQVYIENENLGRVYITKYDGADFYVINGEFKKAGKTTLILVDENKNEYVYELSVGNKTYDIKEQ